MHLNPEELVDIAEGARPESASPHLSGCEVCRAQLLELRAMLSAARDVDVPEPSPLFWDHLSARVSEAVAAEEAAGGARRLAARLTPSRYIRPSRYASWGAMAAALLVAVALGTRALAPAPVPSPATVTVVPPVAGADPGIELLSDWAPEQDASLTLVASLTDDVDMDTAREAGLAPRGSAEHAVTHMSDAELRELRRLLKEELTRSGA